MHPDLEQLLAVRDGEAEAEAARHVASCPECSEELLRLRRVRDALRDLPRVSPEGDLWPATRAKILGAQGRRRAWAWAAAAALVLAASGATLYLTGVGAPPQVDENLASAGLRTSSPPFQNAEEPASPDPEIARLIRDSQRLESLLDRLGERPTVVSGREAAAELGIEDRLAEVDARLSGAGVGPTAREEHVGLWQERVQLLGTLAQVKGAKRKSAAI
jgi:hypothetical protein